MQFLAQFGNVKNKLAMVKKGRKKVFDVWAMPIYTDYFSKMGFPYYILLPPTTAYYISKQDPDRVCDFFEQFNRDFEHLFYLLNCSKWLETFGDLFSQKLEENKLGTNKNEKLKFTNVKYFMHSTTDTSCMSFLDLINRMDQAS